MAQEDSYEFHRERKEKEELTDEQIDILEGYYFEHYARHNEDEAGCERWIENLDYEEAMIIINKKKND